MPYIKKLDQERISSKLKGLELGTQGELTFAINTLMLEFCYKSGGPINYELSSKVMASCRDAETEWLRQIHWRYEDHKKRENGDIFQEFVRKQNL